ncbi:hypothetical protein ACH40F_52470 [Streptomyces sp. NPDC020794]|uniref:hypothetical protein n=1 Tax=unclassified Streptomyces TaxID=2593676 RepID=UPI0036E73CC3
MTRETQREATLGTHALVQESGGQFFLYAALTDTLISTVQHPAVMIRDGIFSDAEIGHLREFSALDEADASQSVEDIYLEKSLYSAVHPYVALDDDGLVADCVIASLEHTPVDRITWVQNEHGKINAGFLNALFRRISRPTVHRLMAPVQAMVTPLDEKLQVAICNVRIGPEFDLNSYWVKDMAHNLQDVMSLTLTLQAGVDSNGITQALNALSGLLPKTNIGLQEDRVPGSARRDSAPSRKIYKIGKSADIPVQNAVVGGGERPLGCPAALPEVVYIDRSGTVRKCPVAGDEGVIGIAAGGRLELDRHTIGHWAKANGYRNRRRECLSCAILPRCFGETCPRAVLSQGTTPCLCPDGRLLEEELGPRPACPPDLETSWLPSCTPQG